MCSSRILYLDYRSWFCLVPFIYWHKPFFPLEQFVMEGEDNILDVIDEEERFDYAHEDVEMLDAEEGELLDHDSKTDMGQGSSGDINIANEESQNKNRKRRANKKKNTKKRKGSGAIDINRYSLPKRDAHIHT